MKQLWAFVVVVIGWSFYAPFFSSAQTATPKLLLTWRTATYAPPDFRGKLLPTANSLITASLDVIDGGVPVNLAGQAVHWYVDDNLISNDSGVQQIKFSAPSAPRPVNLRVELPDYNGADLLKTIEIPVVTPGAVVEAPFPRGSVPSLSFGVKALLYSFNAKNSSALNFSWTANGAPAQRSGQADVLDVALNPATPNGAPITITLAVSNPAFALESAQSGVTLIFQR